MSEHYERSTILTFSNEHIDARWLTGVNNLAVVERTIVVNISTTPIVYAAGGPVGFILPFQSTILQRAFIRSAESTILLRLVRTTNIGASILSPGWRHLNDDIPSFPRSTPLWLSSQDPVGRVELDPAAFVHQPDPGPGKEPFDVKVNLWFSPNETDCAIHTGHKFLEVHTQVYGTGHMQKFSENSDTTMYQDVFMSPGMTHQPFPVVASDGEYSYPWHRYFSDTDCIWMAIELHNITGP